LRAPPWRSRRGATLSTQFERGALTYRDTNSAVTILTGHGSDEGVPDGLDWRAIARGAQVLVLYMASRHSANIAERLMAAGRGPPRSRPR
jgi:siroheme synthase